MATVNNGCVCVEWSGEDVQRLATRREVDQLLNPVFERSLWCCPLVRFGTSVSRRDPVRFHFWCRLDRSALLNYFVRTVRDIHYIVDAGESRV